MAVAVDTAISTRSGAVPLNPDAIGIAPGIFLSEPPLSKKRNMSKKKLGSSQAPTTLRSLYWETVVDSDRFVSDEFLRRREAYKKQQEADSAEILFASHSSRELVDGH